MVKNVDFSDDRKHQKQLFSKKLDIFYLLCSNQKAVKD